MEIKNIYIIFVKNLKKIIIMTQFEKTFYFVADIFGEDVAKMIFMFFIKLITILMRIGYFCTLPFQFVKIAFEKLKDKGVN